MTKAVIFDMDGVLIDSYEAHFQSWVELGQETGITYTRENFAWAFGRTSRECIATFWPKTLTTQQIRELDDRKELLYRNIIAAHLPIMDGILKLIDDLSAAGFKLAVGSSGPPENVWLTVEKLGRKHAFGAVITGMDVKHGKPHPEVFLTAAARLGVSNHHAAVIEDATAGITAALAAGQTAIGLVSTGRFHDQLNEAHLIVDTIPELSPDRIAKLIDSRSKR
jgi:beta-phosphoglucomutase